MELKKIENKNLPYTALFYCKPGVGKSTAIGLIAEKSEGNTLVLDIDRTIMRTLAKGEVVKDTSKVMVCQVDNINTFESWTQAIMEITPEFLKQNNITTVAVDNISELERCILSDLGAKGKNKGVPAQADYQYMQFKLVNSLRYMKNWGVNIIWTAWETSEPFVNPDGTQYTRLQPKISLKIVDNICGLCDIVGWITINKDGDHGILLEATQNIYAKNQVDCRKGCKVEEFIISKKKKEDK
jgi:phage nucleotide-binding protein